MSKTHQYDHLVIGAGIAGLSYALKLSAFYEEEGIDKQIAVITKTRRVEETNTKYAQGGIASVSDLVTDSYEAHVRDTLIAGDGICDPEAVNIVVKEGPDRIKEMIEWGARFDKDQTGAYDLAKEGGHSAHRIYHHKDVTGKEMERALVTQVENAKNITVFTHLYAVDLITQHHLGVKGVNRHDGTVECYGVYVLNRKTNEVEKFLSKVTMLATGGVGQVYKNTTNPTIATGDGIAMAYRAKAQVNNMEFIQFHPTALANGESPSFLITEAMRGAGAILKNWEGEPFMKKYDEREDLAPRDIVARAIDAEMKLRGDSHVFLDCTHIDKEEILNHFPNIYAKCLSIGIDITKEMIPVTPAMHYLCGGVQVDYDAQTTIKNLLASGECACTGLHGANRLASNSLLEALVFSNRAYYKAIELERQTEFKAGIPDWDGQGTVTARELVLIQHNIQELKMFMSDYVGIVRSDIRLERALKRLRLLYEEAEAFYNKTTLSKELLELRNLINVCYLITTSAQNRKENLGLHYNVDYVKEQKEVKAS